MVLASPLPGARVAAERWRKDIESEPIRIAPGVEVNVTLSVGLAARLPSTPSGVALLAAADAALYAAKQAGRNRIAIDPATGSRD
jgi:diguanylate cyclase (GGDEF)-like protein